MFGLIVAGIVVLLVGYCTWVLFFNLDQETATDLSDFIRDTPPGLPQSTSSFQEVIHHQEVIPLYDFIFELTIISCVDLCTCI